MHNLILNLWNADTFCEQAARSSRFIEVISSRRLSSAFDCQIGTHASAWYTAAILRMFLHGDGFNIGKVRANGREITLHMERFIAIVSKQHLSRIHFIYDFIEDRTGLKTNFIVFFMWNCFACEFFFIWNVFNRKVLPSDYIF